MPQAKIKFIISILVFISTSLCSQNKIYKESYNYNTEIKSVKTTPDKILSCYDKGKVYSITKRATYDTDLLNIQEFDIETKKTKIIQIKKSKEIKKLFNESIDDIAHINNKLVVICYEFIYVFNRDNSGYKIEKLIKNDGSFLKLYTLTKDMILCYVNYQYHPLDEPHMHTWAILYMNNDSLGSEKYMDEDNVVFSPYPNLWLSTYKGLIAYSHTADYTIKFYDQNLLLIDSIKSDLLDKNKESLKLISDGTDYSLEEIMKIGAADDTLLTRIEKVFLLDSTNLLVILKQPKTHYMKYDLWQKNKAGWQLHKSQELPGHYENGREYTAKNNAIEGFYGNYSGLTYAGNNEFYFVYYPFMKNPISESYNMQKDYYDKVNELTRKKELYYGIKKLKILTD